MLNNPVNYVDPLGLSAIKIAKFDYSYFSLPFFIGTESVLLSAPSAEAFLLMALLYVAGVGANKAHEVYQTRKRDTRQTRDVTRGMSRTQRGHYHREVHARKRGLNMSPKDNFPNEVLLEIANEINRQYK